MKLSQEQINRLYDFTKQHYVEWYDLQTELVDHLANSIEAQWRENPKISFEEALQLEFKKFGVFGFMSVVEERQMTLGKKYNALVWQHFKTFFTLPKVMVTATLMSFLFFVMQQYAFAAVVITTIFILSSIVAWVVLIKHRRKNKKQSKQLGKKWMFKDIIYSFGNFGGLCYLPVQIALQFPSEFEYSFVPSALISFSVVSYFLFTYIVLKIIPSKAEAYLKETYPEYELAMNM